MKVGCASLNIMYSMSINDVTYNKQPKFEHLPAQFNSMSRAHLFKLENITQSRKIDLLYTVC